MSIRSTPSSVSHAYRIINGTASGDIGEAQKFLKGMSEAERKARQRSEKKEQVKRVKNKRPMGYVYPYTSRRYT